jgi:hypothetical protein
MMRQIFVTILEFQRILFTILSLRLKVFAITHGRISEPKKNCASELKMNIQILAFLHHILAFLRDDKKIFPPSPILSDSSDKPKKICELVTVCLPKSKIKWNLGIYFPFSKVFS